MPIILLTLVCLVLAAFLWQQTAPSPAEAFAFIVIGLAVCVIAGGFLARSSLANIRQLQSLGLTDGLTGLPNRRALQSHLDDLRADDEETAVAMVDLDGFKTVNDHYGHQVGDQLITECAKLFGEICGDDTRVYRLAGDEFAFLTKGQIAGNLLEGACRRLLIRLTKPIHVGERALNVGASVGLARIEIPNALSSSEILRRVEVAMYVSKKAGKMRVTWFTEDFDRHRETLLKLDDELRDALDKDQFRLVYQPLIDTETRKVVAVEGLIRWERPDGEEMGPSTFIPIAEESGLINNIGLWSLRQAFTDAIGWDDLRLSINISSTQLHNPQFPIELGHLLEETGFPPERLELEVTETHLVADSAVAGRSMDVIRDFGVRIVLDDFGTGYASIGFLRQFRFEKLKLDRSMIADAATDSSSRAMMLASVAIARSLDMGVTAEGVETEDQADLVRIAGCDQIQGWLYFKAMPAIDIDALLKTQLADSKQAHGS